MSTPLRNRYVTAALKERRSTIAGELRELEDQAKVKAASLSHIDAVLAMYAPEVDAKALPVRRPRPGRPYAVVGLSRCIRDVLRRRSEPMATLDVAEAIIAEMGFPAEATRSVATAVRYALHNLAKSGTSVVKEGEQAGTRWSLI